MKLITHTPRFGIGLRAGIAPLLVGIGFLTVFSAKTNMASETPATQDRPDFSGVWLLDERASDDIEAELKKLRQGMRSQRGERGTGNPDAGGRGGGRDRSGTGGRQGRGDSGGRGADGESPQASSGNPPSQGRLGEGFAMLLITHQDGQFEVVDGNDRTWAATTDGKTTVQEHEQGNATGVARWDGRVLAESWNLGGRLDVERRYTLAPDGTQLNVDVTITPSGTDQKATAQLVYERP